MFEISTSEFDTVGMSRQFCACAYEFLSMVIEDVVQSVYKVVIWSSFSVYKVVIWSSFSVYKVVIWSSFGVHKVS